MKEGLVGVGRGSVHVASPLLQALVHGPSGGCVCVCVRNQPYKVGYVDCR